jgi:hypothetical protein
VRRLCLVAGIALLSGCAGSKVYVAPNYVSSGKVAVLPMDNESNDFDGPTFVRALTYEGLAAHGFQLLPIPQIDAQLKVQGFTDGGQLRAATPQKLGEWTGADTLLYSTLESFDYINVGYYSQRRVKILAKLVDAKTGEKLWEAEREGSTRAVATNKKRAEELFAIQLAVKAAEKLAHRPLQNESRRAVGELLATLPYRQ